MGSNLLRAVCSTSLHLCAFSHQCPGDDPNEDSLEYNSGDTESDLEIEGAGCNKKGEPLQQLKNQPVNNI